MSVACDLDAIALTAREHYAAQVFNPDAVLARMTARAEQGYNGLRLTQSRALNLQETEAARYLLRLLREENLGHTWNPAFKKGDPLRPGSAVEYPELAIHWGD